MRIITLAKPLSPKMQEALDMARQHGRQLERWPGGFWTYPGCAFREDSALNGYCRVPLWYCTAGTIYALCDRGEATVIQKDGRGGYAIRVEITA